MSDPHDPKPVHEATAPRKRGRPLMVPREQVLELNIDTGVPLLYDIDEAGVIRSKRILK